VTTVFYAGPACAVPHIQAPSRLLVCSLDGSVTLVTLDTLTPIYRMRLSGPVAGPPAFCSRDRLVLHLSTEVGWEMISGKYMGLCAGVAAEGTLQPAKPGNTAAFYKCC
jgi:hypothetical protein